MSDLANPARVLLHAFSTFKLGGPQVRFAQLANAFGARYHHLVVAMDNCFDASERLGPNVSWQALPLTNQRGGALANRASFRAVLKEQRPDMLLSYNWGAIEWAVANLPKYVQQIHVEDGFGPEEVSQQLLRRVWARKLSLGWARVPVIVASRQLQKIALDTWKLSAQHVQFIPNGVAVEADLCFDTATKHALSRKLTIGTVAGLRPEKNIGRLIRAFMAVRAHFDSRLVIVGSGSELQALQTLAKSLGIEADVEFVGHLKDPSQRLREFDLFALSSDTEQLPIAMLEAMALCIPVVATRVGDVAHILPEVAHTALSNADDKSFEETLFRVIAQRDDWAEWAQAGKQKVEKYYSLKVMQTQWQFLFDGQLCKVFTNK